MQSDERRFRWDTVGYWLLGLSLFVGLWRTWQAHQSSQQVMLQQCQLLQRLTRFQMEVVHCDRLVATLGASRSAAVRIGGANPSMLRLELQARLAGAEREFRQLRAALKPLSQASDSSSTMHWAIVRVEAEWLSVYSSLETYLRRPDESHINLETLHTFNLTRQDNLYAAVASLHQAVSLWYRSRMQMLNRQRNLSLGVCLIVVGLWFGWSWYFLVRPAQLMSRWLQTEDSVAREVIQRYLRGTRWGPLAWTLLQQRQRLLEVERFMRDLAMGRTPEPLTPLEPNDRLTRSSFWLLRRVEECCRAGSAAKQYNLPCAFDSGHRDEL